MGIDMVSTHLLIESPQTETDKQFCDVIETMLQDTYGRKPAWLRFSPGARFVRGGVYFRELVCFAAGVAGHLQLRATREGGFSRALIYRAVNDGIPRAYEIRGGVESEFSPDELQVA